MVKKASQQVKRFQNPGGASISTVSRPVFHQDGLYFKDIDGTGALTPVNDWRLPAAQRAAAYVKTLTVKEKIAQLFTSDWRMGPKYPSARLKDHHSVADESGLLDEAPVEAASTIFGQQKLPGTTELLQGRFIRHLILRENPAAPDLADYLDQLQYVAEGCPHFVPVQVMSNSRNENGEAVFGMNDAAGVFAAWPGTLGIAAAVKGTARIDIIDKFADTIRRQWRACGLRKGYMYMADCVTDPRWQRTFGTFGEDPVLIEEIFDHLIPGIQGGSQGVTQQGVSVTVKHFPGGGARENGFDPHYAAGQWNIYATPGSLQKYHVPPFRAAVRHKAEAVMPYYSKPSAEKSAPQQDFCGQPMPMEPYGFAYNKVFIDGMLREQMGFEGYINSDTGITHNMCWGVDMLDVPERIGYAVTHSGVDLISGLFDEEAGAEAYARATNDHYDTHPLPEGFAKEQLVLTDASIDRAVTRTLTELFRQGMFEDCYADPAEAEAAVSRKEDWDEAARVHRESVVLLKNDGTLPLKPGCRIYAEAFGRTTEAGEKATQSLRSLLADQTLVEQPSEADVALLMISPGSGAYFNATPGYLELDICEDKTVCNVGEDGRPQAETHQETTLVGASRIPEIAKAVRANGGKLVANINFPLAWQVGNVERWADALTAGFDTFPEAVLDVMMGRFAPVGKLPLTLPRGDEVLRVDAAGRCVSPNDVPGYAKDAYMPDALKDENGKAYAYRDAAGSYYELGFGLRYEL